MTIGKKERNELTKLNVHTCIHVHVHVQTNNTL